MSIGTQPQEKDRTSLDGALHKSERIPSRVNLEVLSLVCVHGVAQLIALESLGGKDLDGLPVEKGVGLDLTHVLPSIS
jgi:hypothetical protein